MKKSIFLIAALALSSLLFAQSSEKIIIDTRNVALVLSVGTNNRIYQDYIGKKLSEADYKLLKPMKELYLTAGMEDQFEPAIRMIHTDGNPSLELQYVKHELKKQNNNVSVTAIHLKDAVYPVQVVLYYKTYFNEDVMESWAEITQQEKKPVMMTQYASSMLHFKTDAYWLTQFYGDWAQEVNMKEEQLTKGIKTLDSKLGTRANFFQTQFFFLSLDKPSTETNGELIAGSLNWTGNFQFTFEIDPSNSLRLRSGINPYASEYYLESGEKFITPSFLFTYSAEGKGLASRNLHRWARNYAVLDGNGSRMTLLNNWEATNMSFDEHRLVELFGEAANLGVDLFLLDDGWFGNAFPRNDDDAGLGDWQENKAKLPSGIGYLVREAEKKGVKFGIWLEPEMVNPKSELYLKHPEWILKLPNRAENYFRNQLVLDMANPKVQDYVYGIVDDMMTKYPGVAFIKWDCNRSMTNAYSSYLKQKQSHLYIEYTRGFYKVMDRVRLKYPKLPIMLCSGGGGRADYGAMKYFTEFWPSDNTDALERIFIQWGYSYFFPANTISAHITNMGKQSLKFRTDVAMMGKMGYDIRVNGFTPVELKFSQDAIQTYKHISDIVWKGELFRLVSPYEENRAAVMYADTNKTRAVIFNFHLNTRRNDIFSPVLLRGLDKQKKYRLEEINLFPGSKSRNPDNGKIFSGEYLMTAGLNLSSGNVQPLTSSIYELTEITP